MTTGSRRKMFEDERVVTHPTGVPSWRRADTDPKGEYAKSTQVIYDDGQGGGGQIRVDHPSDDHGLPGDYRHPHDHEYNAAMDAAGLSIHRYPKENPVDHTGQQALFYSDGSGPLELEALNFTRSARHKAPLAMAIAAGIAHKEGHGPLMAAASLSHHSSRLAQLGVDAGVVVNQQDSDKVRQTNNDTWSEDLPEEDKQYELQPTEAYKDTIQTPISESELNVGKQLVEHVRSVRAKAAEPKNYVEDRFPGMSRKNIKKLQRGSNG